MAGLLVEALYFGVWRTGWQMPAAIHRTCVATALDVEREKRPASPQWGKVLLLCLRTGPS